MLLFAPYVNPGGISSFKDTAEQLQIHRKFANCAKNTAVTVDNIVMTDNRLLTSGALE